MKIFKWCPQEIAEGCYLEEEHSHICITTPGYREIKPACGKQVLNLAFYDLDPASLKKRNAPENLISGCFREQHAHQIATFTKGGDFVVVNCEAGISRSPGVVLALRRFYGGDTEEPFRRAHPNAHVTSILSRVLLGQD
jgi:protein-tyrosine phosphatase